MILPAFQSSLTSLPSGFMAKEEIPVCQGWVLWWRSLPVKKHNVERALCCESSYEKDFLCSVLG